MKNNITIIIADDHPIVRSGLRKIIETDSRLIVLGEANNGVEAVAMIEELKPEIAIIDVDMPELDGFGVAREVKKSRLDVKIVFLTLHRQEDFFHAAMDLGVLGYILKDSVTYEIVNGIKSVAEGQFYVSSVLTNFLIQRNRAAQNFAEQNPSIKLLTATERRVLQMVGDYKSNKEIADELFIHFRTVETHRTNITKKLDLHGHKALLKFAIEHKDEL